MGKAVDIYVTDNQDVPLPLEPLRRLAHTVLEEEQLPPETEVGIMFVTDEAMAVHNRRFLGREGPTDVLALPLVPAGAHRRVGVGVAPGGVPYGLGDVIVAPAVVHRQAAEHGVEPTEEMSLIVAHGLLHLIGYDHETDTEAAVMEDRERSLLARVGVERR